MLVVFDADGLIAYFDPEDSNHARADILFQNLLDAEAQALFPITAVCEAVTVLQKQLPKRKPHLAGLVAEKFQAHILHLQTPNEKIILDAFTMFNPYTFSDTLFDSIIATIALQYKADAIFSFDKVYKRMRKDMHVNLWLAEELFPTTQPSASKPN